MSLRFSRSEMYAQLEVCRRLVAEKMERTDIDNWIHSDYLKLSALLFKETRVNISINTLKRIFGKLKTDDVYCPQKASLDAMARFVGFVDWEDFESSHDFKNDANTESHRPNVPTSLTRTKNTRSKFLIKITAIVFPIVTIIILWISFSQEKPLMKLTCKNPEGQGMLSAVFQIVNLKGSSIVAPLSIDFGDGKRDTIKKNHDQIVHYYGHSGRYLAVLRYGDTPLDTVAIYVKTRGWSIAALPRDSGYYELNKRYDAHLGSEINAKDVKNAGVDTLSAYFLSYLNIKTSKISGDNMEFSADVKALDVFPRRDCGEVRFTIYGDSSEHRLSLTQMGCAAMAGVSFSELKKNGIEEDLSGLGMDLKKGGKVRLVVKGKNVTIFLNGKSVLTAKYQKTLGNVSGISIVFKGIGKASGVCLRSILRKEEF